MATSLSEATSLDAKGRIVGSQLADAVTVTVGAQSIARVCASKLQNPIFKLAKIRRRRKKSVYTKDA
jgi:hypothetical protein